METRAPFIIVGAFVLAAIGAVFGFVYWLHNTAGSGARTTHHVQFEGSVSGLLVGAACLAIAIPAAVHSDPPANSPVAAGVHRTPDGMARASARFADFGTVKLSPRRTPRGRQGGRFK